MNVSPTIIDAIKRISVSEKVFLGTGISKQHILTYTGEDVENPSKDCELVISFFPQSDSNIASNARTNVGGDNMGDYIISGEALSGAEIYSFLITPDVAADLIAALKWREEQQS